LARRSTPPPGAPEPLPAPGALIAEPVQVRAEAFDAAHAAPGEPAVPLRFAWRGHAFEVVAVERRWRTTGPMRGGGRERYVRRHWVVVRTRSGPRLRLYGARGARPCWVLHSVEEPGAREGGDLPPDGRS
jgi:hypothetical protein